MNAEDYARSTDSPRNRGTKSRQTTGQVTGKKPVNEQASWNIMNSAQQGHIENESFGESPHNDNEENDRQEDDQQVDQNDLKHRDRSQGKSKERAKGQE